ncbi:MULTISPECIES: hypothetical protein [Kordiimonas]|jgi:hypothetical protein|uniref:hypothetical protein n=1 Tax=Kordiimonas TaxID=288021 RepID=UPI0025802105|nr:hypothetical protein [Kordiimonas sp. UBA4487]
MKPKQLFKRLLLSLLFIVFCWISVYTYFPWYWEFMYRGDGDYEVTYDGWVFQNYNLTFSDISLSEPGTYTYKAAGLQTNSNPSVALFMENPSDFDKGNLDAEVSVKIRDGNGELFFEVSGPLIANRSLCGLSRDEVIEFRNLHPTYWYAMQCREDSKLARDHHVFAIGGYGKLEWSWWENYTIEVTVEKPSEQYPDLRGRLKIQSGWK